MGVGAGKAELGVCIVPVGVAVAGDEGVCTEPVMMDVSGLFSFKKAFAGVMVTVDNLGVDVIESIESWLVMRDKVGVDGLSDCVAPCGCGWATGIATIGTGGGGAGNWN